MMFQDGEELRNVPDPTNVQYIPGQISGHICCTGLSADRVGQVHPEKLSTPISSQGWGRSSWGSWSWLCPKKALSWINQIQPGERLLWGTTQMWAPLMVWPVASVVWDRTPTVATKSLLLCAQYRAGLELPSHSVTPDVLLTPMRMASCPGWH